MARYRVQGPDGKIHVFEGPDGASPADVETFAAQTFGGKQPAAETPTDRQSLLASTPMRFAKGGKDTFDAGAQLMRKAVGEWNPMAIGIKKLTGVDVPDAIDALANKIGGRDTFAGDVLGVKGATDEQLRQDINASEVEYQAARKATGQEGFDAARLAGNVLSPVSATVGRFAPIARAGAPMKVIAGKGAAAGAAGAAFQPVMGEDFATEKAGQMVAGVVGGGVAAPIFSKLANSIGGLIQRYRGMGTVNVSPEGLRVQITKQLADDGIDASQIPEGVFQRLNEQVRSALASGRKMDPAALLRKQDFDALNIPATQGQLTRNPAQWQREFNLMGVEGVGEPLQDVAAQQSQRIAGRFRNTAGERFDAGRMLTGQLRAADDVAQDNVRAAYNAFRQNTGRELEVPMQGLAQDYAKTIETFGDAIPAAVRKQFEGLGLLSGKQLKGLSIEQAENLIKTINANTDPMNKVGSRALGDLRVAVQRSITDAADSSAMGAEAAHLASEARGAAAQRFRTIEGTPSLQAAINNAEPDDFVRKFVIGGKVNEIERMQQLLGPEGREQVRAQTLAYLQQKAFGANAAGDGKAAQATFNNELNKIGRPKLVALLGEEGANEMQRIGRVLAYIKQVPEGATPNVSGTGQAMTSLLGKTKGLLGLPYVNDFVVRPLGKFGERREVAQSLSGVPSVPAELDPQTAEALRKLFAPAAVGSGAALGYSVR